MASLSVDSNTESAVAEAATSIRADLGAAAPDVVFVFASIHHRVDPLRLTKAVERALSPRLVVGCSAQSVIGAGREVEGRPGLSLTAAVLPGVELRPVRVTEEAVRELEADAWRAGLGLAVGPTPHFVLLADPFSSDVETLVQRLDEWFPNSVKIGGLASGGRQPGENSLYLGSKVYRSGLVGVALQGNLELDSIVAQGCRPIGNPMFVTRCQDNVLLELDGRRALELVESLYRQATPRDRELMSTSLFLGIEMRPEQGEYRQGDFLIRNLVGAEPESGALTVSARLQVRQVVQFHLRDAKTSAEDLERQLGRYARAGGVGGSSAGALLFSCLGRGSYLYGRPDHDTEGFRRLVGDLPLGGFFCNGEIGPVEGQTFVHGYTSAFGIFRSRRRLDA